MDQRMDRYRIGDSYLLLVVWIYERVQESIVDVTFQCHNCKNKIESKEKKCCDEGLLVNRNDESICYCCLLEIE